MENLNDMEDFVTYNQAVKLKDLGFDWECTHYYSDRNDKPREWDAKNFDYYHIQWDYNYTEYMVKVSFDKDVPEENLFEDFYSAPTLAQAQKWLREKGLIINITYEPVYYYGDIYNINKNDYEHIITEKFETYDSVLSVMIDKALEILECN